MSDEKREALNDFLDGNLSVADLAEKFPDCACESAVSPDGSPGPVADHERLRLYLTSRSDIDARKPAKRTARRFTAQSLKKAYTKGLSTYRLSHASASELEHGARLLYEYQVSEDPEHGGVMGVMDFPAHSIRYCDGLEWAMCVHETPLDLSSEALPPRPSHADVVASRSPPVDPVELKAHRDLVFNHIVKHGQQRNSEDVDDSNLNQFLPMILRNGGEA